MLGAVEDANGDGYQRSSLAGIVATVGAVADAGGAMMIAIIIIIMITTTIIRVTTSLTVRLPFWRGRRISFPFQFVLCPSRFVGGGHHGLLPELLGHRVLRALLLPPGDDIGM